MKISYGSHSCAKTGEQETGSDASTGPTKATVFGCEPPVSARGGSSSATGEFSFFYNPDEAQANCLNQSGEAHSGDENPQKKRKRLPLSPTMEETSSKKGKRNNQKKRELYPEMYQTVLRAHRVLLGQNPILIAQDSWLLRVPPLGNHLAN